jgi:hypothetical protein
VSRSMAFDITVKTRVKVDAHLNLKFSASGRVFVAGDIRRRSYDHLKIVLNETVPSYEKRLKNCQSLWSATAS